MRRKYIKHKPTKKGLGPVAINGSFMENHLPTTESSLSPPFHGTRTFIWPTLFGLGFV